MTRGSLTDVPGVLVGHWTHTAAGTGCTVILTPTGAVAGVDVRGGAPGTRETSLLDPTCLVERVHAVTLAGGSAFGLAAADGVMRWLEERGHGFDVGVAKVPIVPAAILFDLNVGRADVRPNADAGYAACVAAHAGPVDEGSVGAGTGATIGKRLGGAYAVKGGVGSASARDEEGLVVAALAVVNAWGEVFDPRDGQRVAGSRAPHAHPALRDPHATAAWADLPVNPGATDAPLTNPPRTNPPRTNPTLTNPPLTNTTLVVVATNAALSKAAVTKVAQMAQDGLARAVRPVHTPFDGDVVFALSLGAQTAQVGAVGELAAEVTAAAIVRGALAATGLHGIPAAHEVGA